MEYTHVDGTHISLQNDIAQNSYSRQLNIHPNQHTAPLTPEPNSDTESLATVQAITVQESSEETEGNSKLSEFSDSPTKSREFQPAGGGGSLTEERESESTISPEDLLECLPCQCNVNSPVIQNVVYVMPVTPLPPPTSCDCKGQSNYNNDISSSNYSQRKNGEQNITSSHKGSKTIFVITPTYACSTQKIDMTSMCSTLMHIPNLVWIVIEDAFNATELVSKLLHRCKVKSIHLVVPTSSDYKLAKGKPKWSKPRGVEQRNAGLSWLRQHYNASSCNGVFYFGDDDNKYDLRLFDEVRQCYPDLPCQFLGIPHVPVCYPI